MIEWLRGNLLDPLSICYSLVKGGGIFSSMFVVKQCGTVFVIEVIVGALVI